MLEQQLPAVVAVLDAVVVVVVVVVAAAADTVVFAWTCVEHMHAVVVE